VKIKDALAVKSKPIQIKKAHKLTVPYHVSIGLDYFKQLLIWFTGSLVIGAILILIAGENPVRVYSAILVEGFLTQRGMMIAIQRATPLILVSTAAVLAFQGGAINMGLEGQFLVGAAVASLVGANLPEMPKFAAIIIVLFCCAIGGAIAGWIPAFFKMVSGVSEVITGMIANLMMPSLISIAFGLPYIRDLRRAALQGGVRPWATFAQFNDLTQGGIGFGTKANTGIFVAIAMVLIMTLVMRRTKIGYEIRMSSANYGMAVFAGIKARRRFYTSLMLSGAIAAIAGATEILGIWRGYYTYTISVGYSGLVVALVGGNTFIGSMIASLIHGGLQSGTLSAAWQTGIPRPFINILIEVLFLFSAIPSMRMFFTGKGDSGKDRLGTEFTEIG
jgi:general nucleoside transport system permease protein